MRSAERTSGPHARGIGWLLVGAATAAAIGVHALRKDDLVGDVAYLVVTVGAAIVAWIGALRAARAVRLIPILIAAGVTASALGDLIYDVIVWRGSAPDTSVADVAWFASYAFVGSALLVLLRRGALPRRSFNDVLLDVAVTATVLALVLWEVAIEPMLADTTSSVATLCVWAVYPLADAVLLALVARTVMQPESRRGPSLALAAGIAFWLVADLGFLFVAGGDALAIWLDTGWLLGAMLLSWAAWNPPAAEPVPAADPVVETTKLGSILLAFAPLLVPMALDVQDHVTGQDAHPQLLMGATLVLVTLALLRTLQIMRSERQAWSDVRSSRRHYEYLAFHDVLTGLANRALYRDRLEHAMRLNARSGAEVAVLYIDLDGFKNVNDSLGHDAGDLLLQQVARRITAVVRSGDTLARLGGDEFGVLIEQSVEPQCEAEAIAARIAEVLTEPFDIAGEPIRISASVGIAVGEPESDASSLVRNADIAMYQAKARGKGRAVTFDAQMRDLAMERVQFERDIPTALADGHLRLVYQPLVDVASQRIVGFEALLRWKHPTLGEIAPDKFIPIAEESSAIDAIGSWVLQEATVRGAQWQRRFPQDRPLTMSVNVAAGQLASVDFAEQVTGALTGSQLAPGTLVLELTESALVSDPATVAATLHRVKALDVRVAVDDFGTGYSSLSYLRQFPIDILKIDRSFISSMTDRSAVPAIVRCLIDLGHTLGLEMIAEGVENLGQLTGLRAHGCEMAQGFLFARPLELADAEALLARQAQGIQEATERVAVAAAD